MGQVGEVNEECGIAKSILKVGTTIRPISVITRNTRINIKTLNQNPVFLGILPVLKI